MLRVTKLKREYGVISLGSNIRNKRKSLKLSQEYVAKQLHVSRQAVSKWESQNRRQIT